MKKKLIFVVAPLLLLTACKIPFLPGKEVSSSHSDVSSLSSSISSGTSSTNSSSENNTSSQSSSSASSKIDIAEVFTQEFVFFDANITNGSNLSNTKPNTALMTYMNKDKNLVSSIVSDNCFYQPVGSGEKNAICVGTSSYGGEITFNFTVPFTKVTFSIQGYNKMISANNYSSDADSQLTVLDKHYELSSDEVNKQPEVVTDSLSFDAITSITFSNDGDHQRAFIHSLTVEFVIY